MLFLKWATLLHMQLFPNDTNKVKDHILSENNTCTTQLGSLTTAYLHVLDLKDFIYTLILHTSLCLHILYLKYLYYCSYIFVFLLFVYIFICNSATVYWRPLKRTSLGFTKISHSLDNLGLRTTLWNMQVKVSSSPSVQRCSERLSNLTSSRSHSQRQGQGPDRAFRLFVHALRPAGHYRFSTWIFTCLSSTNPDCN